MFHYYDTAVSSVNRTGKVSTQLLHLLGASFFSKALSESLKLQSSKSSIITTHVFQYYKYCLSTGNHGSVNKFPIIPNISNILLPIHHSLLLSLHT